MIGNVLKIIYVYFGASRIRCGKIQIGEWIRPPLPLACHKYPTLSRVKVHCNYQLGKKLYLSMIWLHFLEEYFWDGHIHPSSTDRLYKIILWNKFGIIGNPLGHPHTIFRHGKSFLTRFRGLGRFNCPHHRHSCPICKPTRFKVILNCTLSFELIMTLVSSLQWILWYK